MERWQKAARQSKQVAYRLSAPFLDRPIVINAETDYRADDADQWVQVERYIRGEIQDLGGVTKSNAHVKLPDGSTLRVTVEREVLRNDTVNRLYKMAMLRIKAGYNVLTRELRNARLSDRIRVKDDFKLLAQCDCEAISHLISEDASTLAKYIDRARDAGLATTQVVLLRDGFDAAWFENGQKRLVP